MLSIPVYVLVVLFFTTFYSLIFYYSHVDVDQPCLIMLQTMEMPFEFMLIYQSLLMIVNINASSRYNSTSF